MVAHSDGHDIPAKFLDYWGFVEVARANLLGRYRETYVSSNIIALSLNRTSGMLTSLSESMILRSYKLTWSGFRILFVLWNLEKVDQSNLTVLIGASKATVSNLVHTLERQDLVERQRSLTDKRTYTINLTPKGHAVVERVNEEQNELFLQWTSVLSQEEKETLQIIIDKLMDRRDIFQANRPPA